MTNYLLRQFLSKKEIKTVLPIFFTKNEAPYSFIIRIIR